jgi:hypothetical protein
MDASQLVLPFPKCLVSRAGSNGRCNTIWSVGPTITSPGERTCLDLLAETQAWIVFWVILTWWALLALVFNAIRVRTECCVDPLTPPALPDKCPNLLPFMQFLIQLQQPVKLFQPLVQSQIGHPLHSDRVRQPVDRFTAAKIEEPAARSQRFIPSTFAQGVVNHLSGYAVRFGFGFHTSP